jgi:fatty-acyl-CoA synthase
MEWAASYGDRLALVGDCEAFSFAELGGRINQYARWALAERIEKGETVALVMRNRPEYFAIWMGLTQVGVIVALISPDLAVAGLEHAFRVACGSATFGPAASPRQRDGSMKNC